jgi:hypothetical protein
MVQQDARLSDVSAAILTLIAEGRSYDQILQRRPDLTYLDIFAAAREAMNLFQAPVSHVDASISLPPIPHLPDAGRQIEVPPSIKQPDEPHPALVPAMSEVPAVPGRRLSFVERARATYGKAFTRWSRDEDDRLRQLFSDGVPRTEISRALDRHPGAIENRLVKLGLIDEAEATARPTRRGSRRSQDRPAPDAVPLPMLSRQPTGENGPPTGAVPDTSSRPERPPVPGWESFRLRLDEPSNSLD